MGKIPATKFRRPGVPGRSKTLRAKRDEAQGISWPPELATYAVQESLAQHVIDYVTLRRTATDPTRHLQRLSLSIPAQLR